MIDWIIKRKWWLFALILLGGLAAWFEQWRTARTESRQDEHILAAARKYEMDPALIKAVVWRESRFNPNVRGKAGEIGLMQIGELAAREWADAEGLRSFDHQELFDPAKNTLAGAWYLRKMLRRYAHTDNPASYALAAYNAGATHVARWNQGAGRTNSAVFLAQMDYPGTRRYVESVLKRQKRYQRTLARLPR